ncbi:hypothetical protein CVT24_005954 [Panaeolus cyanescens]|uniref:Nephrocystin 3-like N-terminal domain-containing protein n=1 Tax=Panaeolus cyanescens TaxID=181874 RepID=A0A409YE56_9AGAR|nr:hypothetical protein CVT24_005954 [Panaeolus cyanescens]
MLQHPVPIPVAPFASTYHHSPSTSGPSIIGGKGLISQSNINQYNSTHYNTNSGNGMEILGKHIIPGASHDSYENENMEDIGSDSDDEADKVLTDMYEKWFRSTLPTGETNTERPVPAHIVNAIHFALPIQERQSIVNRVCADLEKKGLLAASFFVPRPPPHSGGREKLIPTLAYQMAQYIPSMRPHIERSVSNDPAFIHRSFKTQLDKLIAQPLKLAKEEGNAPSEPKIIVLEGLEHCGDWKTQLNLICTFENAMKDGDLPLRLLIIGEPAPEVVARYPSPTTAV